MATKTDINDFYRGDTQKYQITLTDSNGNPIDLNGATVWFTMKRKTTDSDENAAVQKYQISHIDAENGVTQIILNASDTVNLEPSTYYYDFQLVDSADEVKTFLAGKVKLLTDVTRSV